MAKRRRIRNPHFVVTDDSIRAILADESAPDDVRDRLLAAQIDELRRLKTQEDPHWQDSAEPPVEIREYRDSLSLDRMVRHGRRGDA